MKRLSNSVLLEKLISGLSVDYEEAMAYLYNALYPKVHRLIIRNSGQNADVKDILQDALFAIFRMAKEGRLNDNIEIEAYTFSVCRNLWLKQLEKKKKQINYIKGEISNPVKDFFSPEEEGINKKELLQSVINKLGTGCRTILLAFYFQRQSMEEIVQSMNLSSVQVAKNKKYKCMKQLKALIFKSDYYKNNLS